MAEADWDEVTYLRKKPQRAADAKTQKVSVCKSRALQRASFSVIILFKAHQR